MIKPSVVAIVPAAGIGRRFGGSVRKTFVELKGIPLLVHTLSRLSEVASISDIIPVLRADDIETGRKLFAQYKIEKVRQIVAGGAERQDSINNAVKLIEGDCIVLIHDGARPIISEKLVANLLENLEGVDGVIPGLPVKETLKQVDGNGMVVSTVDREKFRSIQTPQAFTSGVIKRAYKMAYADGFYGTDDAALVERAGGRVKIIPGDHFNIKITTQEDLELAEMLIERRSHL
ncbi:MAG: 2-C-methyl-D-erythritol 4-phosphate cytidylyltransferase [Thermodesulfovibrionia bacterium]|nr:2-C-methyl-D-erythritol 4-phosphate cytidylyltransferase [Thermodesulfovibrionia bacterium]